MKHLLWTSTLSASLLLAGGCDKPDGTGSASTPATQAAAAPQTNRIDIPAAVRQNLGITFAKVERRRVASTLRVPGRFELLPSARREYRSTLPGWVNLLVAQYDDVKKGTPIYQVDSPEWHKLRKQLHEGQAAIAAATAELAVAEQSKAEAEAVVKALEQRTQALAGAEVRRAELETELATRRASVPRLDAELKVRQAALNEAKQDFTLQIDTVASLLGLSPKFLTGTAEPGENAAHDADHPIQRWYAIGKIGQMAAGPGVVESLHVTDGSWVEVNTLVATTVNPTALRFRATGLQSDLGRLRDGLPSAVAPPQGGGFDPAQVVSGKLKVGVSGDPNRRTIELLMTPESVPDWAKPGVSASLEVALDPDATEQLAIPLSCVVRDGLTPVIFRRDPRNPDKVIRMEADLGPDDGRWVVLSSGVAEGDEVVLDGAYQLLVATSGTIPKGGHFHPDGTFHEGDE